LTDIHLDFLEPLEIDRLCEEVRQGKPDGLLISGDISLADRIEHDLQHLETAVPTPIYFVLGNHDYYGSSIAEVRASVEKLCRIATRLHWLTMGGVFRLNTDTALVGHDSWSDGRLGDYANSPVLLNDYFLIKELSWLEPEERLIKLNALGDEAAAFFEKLLPEAFDDFARVVLLTHVPPFERACWHDGRISDTNYLPHFSCKAVGDVLLRTMQERPSCRLTVLCGHTHGYGVAQILPNLEVRTGGAVYGKPAVQELIELT
jgi:Icc protein